MYSQPVKKWNSSRPSVAAMRYRVLWRYLSSTIKKSENYWRPTSCSMRKKIECNITSCCAQCQATVKESHNLRSDNSCSCFPGKKKKTFLKLIFKDKDFPKLQSIQAEKDIFFSTSTDNFQARSDSFTLINKKNPSLCSFRIHSSSRMWQLSYETEHVFKWENVSSQ